MAAQGWWEATGGHRVVRRTLGGGHLGAERGDREGIFGGYGVAVGSLWGRKVIRRDVGLS